jgi:hypothetical protein
MPQIHPERPFVCGSRQVDATPELLGVDGTVLEPLDVDDLAVGRADDDLAVALGDALRVAVEPHEPVEHVQRREDGDDRQDHRDCDLHGSAHFSLRYFQVTYGNFGT